MKTAILDTNVWVAFFLQSDFFHYETKRLIGRLLRQKYTIIIPPSVAYETMNILGKNDFKQSDIKKFIDYWSNYSQFKIIEYDYHELLNTLIRFLGRVSLKSQDFIIFLYCAKFKPSKFITFDEDFKLAAKSHLNL